MKKDFFHKFKSMFNVAHFGLFVTLLVAFFVLFFLFPEFFASGVTYVRDSETIKSIKKSIKPTLPPLDTILYDKKINELANNPPPKPPTTKVVKDPQTGVETTVTVEPKPIIYPWPVKTVYPNAGAILPFKRIIAYYGNLFSTKMGVLGEYPPDEMLQRLNVEVKKWELADPSTPIVPALHYIAVVAQASPGADGKYRARMPHSEIDKVLAMAEKVNAIVFLDIQVGFSTLQAELPVFEKYFKLPNVHLGVDAEFSMKSGIRPGKVVGTYDAEDINFAANYLAKIIKENNLPPKVLVVHRYTQKMITNYKEIKPLPEVQIVMHMDGWGGKAKKINTYQQFIYKEPVQFTGFKLFYKNDILTPGTILMTPNDLLKLSPQPIYVQYQ
ncbi:hypothetical protein A3A95_03035 [Candidatus Nomurabacteria bacterium RIFCSPLOWO2_01_FULL_39_18]|uniref:Lipoprotein n=1 Tax=Candidatus Nomurabacteria bacterium RIFCSPHIGHO2_01_FULL_40_24b TaxID=1801739 RepID=A0A1F6V720_9BACT|nr:MAG: hypothetical protein A2647_03530 [Candidatus Nomurabacteria bacterium RIFCSPHIGHO2_01_FULL_40_24b]OGI89632.1 MAG: hypothetical protein A3A95_03035 [Candidatus Nomurabacteria bacterium RIFCSPLOWO2_01_FULL_39_18]